MIHFAWPWCALLMPLPFVMVWWTKIQALRQQHKQPQQQTPTQLALRHPRLADLRHAYQHSKQGRLHADRLPFLLFLLIWLLLVLALMQPQQSVVYNQVNNQGYDLMLAVDLSRSMLALDFSVDGQAVNRLQVVKGVVGHFIEQRQGDRIGLILFADHAYLQSPLTLDGQSVKQLLADSVPRMLGDATAIGDAIGLAVKKLRERPEKSRVLILLTDGDNTKGQLSPKQAALLAAQYQIRIYTIGVGRSGAVPFPVEKDDIVMQTMTMDEGLLRTVADITGGAYYRATDTEALQHIYNKINELEKTDAKQNDLIIAKSLYRWPLGMALLGLLFWRLAYPRV
jgi:Ca-activated chloride channel family protein